MHQHQDRPKNKFESELTEIRKEITRTLADIRQKFVEKVHERIQAVSADEIAESLTKRVLITRPASREELKSHDTLKIRQAYRNEAD